METNLMLERVAAFLESRELQFQIRPENSLISAVVTTKLANYLVILQANDDDPFLRICVRYPLLTSEARIAEVSEWVLRLNHEIPFGKFDFDHSDGEVRFDLCTWFHGAPMDDEAVDQLLRQAIGVADDWLPSIARMIYTDADPREEVATCLAAFAKRAQASDEAAPEGDGGT